MKMNGPRRKPSNMGELCRLCLGEGKITSPIFGEEDSPSRTRVPLSFRIMACVSVEVSLSDGLPKVICEKCLDHVNSWHEFKETCDISQATLKEWLNNSKDDSIPLPEKDIVVKQEPMDPEPEDEILEVIDEPVDCQILVDDIKQEVDMYGEDDQDSTSVEAVDVENSDPLESQETKSSDAATGGTGCAGLEVVEQPSGDVSHLQITDIKTESGDVVPIGSLSADPAEGRLLRSVLQGKNLSMYSKKVAVPENLPAVKPFQCRLCDKSFSFNYLLKRHGKTHKGDRNVCSYCQKGFSSHSILVQHVRCYSGTISTPYSCDICQHEFACKTHYLAHVDGTDGSGCEITLAEKDTSNGDLELAGQNNQCEVCLEKFSSLMLLRLHMRKEHLLYSCHKCEKTFSNGVALSNHLRSHSVGAVKNDCKSCSKSFPSFEMLKKHERTHMHENSAMAMIPTDVVSSEYADHPNETAGSEETVCERRIKEEPPDSPEGAEGEGAEEEAEAEAEAEEAHTTESVADAEKTHVCHLCNEYFATYPSLRFHMKGAHLHYQCHRCPKVFSSGVALSNHLRSHSLNSYNRPKCPICRKSFSSEEVLIKHKRTHSTLSSARATSQDRVDVNRSLTKEKSNDFSGLIRKRIENNKEDSENSIEKRRCKICNLITASPSALKRHMACHINVKMYTCSICHVSMSYASSLQKHYRLIHREHVELRSIQQDASVAVDDMDGSVSTGHRKRDEFPERVETSTRSGRKVIFNRAFKMTAQLQHAKLPTPYECKTCRRSFAYRSFLLKHSRMCAAASEVTCQICFKKFPDAKTLNNHKGVHTRFKHFSCNVCGKSFNGLNAWQKHERMHQKGFIYSCKLCGKRFLSKAELHEHKKMHIKVKIYTCAVCKNSYHSSSALGKHKRRHGHWYASSESSEVEAVNGSASNGVPVLKPSVPKEHPTTTPSASKSVVIRTGILGSALAKSLVHFPAGKKRPYCGICKKTFSHMSALRRHKRSHHQTEQPAIPQPQPNEELVVTEDNSCLTCNRTFPDHISLVRHKGWHTRRSMAHADVSFVSTTAKLTMNPCFVKLEAPPVNAYQCSLCSKTFTTSVALDTHVKSHSEVKSLAEKPKAAGEESAPEVLSAQRRLACKICKKPFESKKALITHIGWHSRLANNPSLGAMKFPKISLKATAKISTVEKFSCNVCHKTFSSSIVLSKHKRLHTRKLMSSVKERCEAPQGSECSAHHVCSFCDRAFKLEKYLLLHMRLHTGEKRFQCNLCPQTYHRSGSLWKHKRTHHAMKVFSCHVCQKRFGLKNQLTKHLETHESTIDFINSETVFACSLCERTFPTLSKFKQHERSHHS